MLVETPPPVIAPPRQQGGEDDTSNQNCAKKRRVKITYRKPITLLRSAVTSENPPLEIREFKDKDGPAKPTSQTIKIEGNRVGYEEETALVAHTTASVPSEGSGVNNCFEYGTTSMCKTEQCECRKANCT